MIFHYKKTVFFALLITILFSCYSNILRAEESNSLLQPEVYSVLTEVHENMKKKKIAQSKSKLQQLLLLNKLEDYDRAIIYQTMGYLENRSGNFEAAIINFEKTLSLHALPETVTHVLYYAIAQLLIHIEQPKKGLQYLNKWFATEVQPKADAHILAATAYYQTQNYSKLILHIEKALALSENPPLNWYQLLLTACYETKEYKKAAEVLELLITQHPNKSDYWLQIVNVYQQAKQEKKALAFYELAYVKGILNKDEKIQLAKTYLYLNMPYKAGKLLEKEFFVNETTDNREILELLVDSWLLAQEKNKAVSVLIKIVNLFNDDEARLRLGQIYAEREDWDKTVALLNVPLQSKNKHLHPKINLLLGIAQYHMNNLTQAIHTLTQALSDQETREQAKWWLEYLKRTAKVT